MDTLRDLLNAECDYRMKDETMDLFLGLMTEMRLKNREAVIPYGKVDDNIYVLRDGIIRCAYFDGQTEKTKGFYDQGSLVHSYICYYMHEPSPIQYESCGHSVVMKVTNKKFNELIEQSSDFAHWVSRIYIRQLAYYDMRTAVIAGTAAERLEAIIVNRPEILQKCTGRIIASYIGITETSFSRLKKQLLRKTNK
jgi:CRP-like cAMP-binding protein